METGIDKLTTKIRGSSKVEQIQGNKCAESTQVQQSASEKKPAIRRKANRKEQNADKAGNCGSLQRRKGSAKQSDTKDSLKDRPLIEIEGKQKKFSSQKLARKQRIESLKIKVASLKKESLRLNCEYRRWATICVELQEQITEKRKLRDADTGTRTPDSEKSVLVKISSGSDSYL